MSQAKLILSQTPAPTVPLRFFFSAPLFGMAAGALILWQGDTAFSHRWSPGILAATHLLVLGYLTMVMQGALLQVVSVVTGGQPPKVKLLSTLIHITTTTGSLLLAAGLLIGGTALLHGAIALLGFSFTLFIGTIAAGLLKSSTRHDAGNRIGLSLACLAVTIGLGIWLGLGHSTENIALDRHLTDTHLTWGLIGWSCVLLITVAYEVIPMFQLTPVYPDWLRRYLVWILFVGLLSWSYGTLARTGTLTLIGGILCALSLTAFALGTLWLQRQRKKKQLDATIHFWRLAMISLLLAITLWGAATAIPDLGRSPTYPLALGILLIYGLFVSAVSGMLYKILPFLSWLHLSIKVTEHKLSRRLIPNIKKIIPDERAGIQFWAHLATLALMLAATWQPSWFVAPMGIAMMLSNAALWLNLWGALRVYQQTTTAIGQAAKAAQEGSC
jgi:hypothetical protein